MGMYPLPTLWHEPSQAQIIHYILDFLDTILDSIRAFSQRVVLEIEHREAGVQVLDELRNLDRAGVVA